MTNLISRREFLGSALAVAAGLAIPKKFAVPAAISPDITYESPCLHEGAVPTSNSPDIAYGSLYLHEGAIINIDVSTGGQGVYTKITGFTTGLLNDISINSDAFNVGTVGVYKVDWEVSGDSDGNNKNYEIDIFINGVRQSYGAAQREFGGIGSLGFLSSIAILDITNTDHDIDLRLKEVGSGAGTDFNISNMAFNVMRVN